MIRHAYWDTQTRNAGDAIVSHILSVVRPEIRWRASAHWNEGKVLSIGSVLDFALRAGDTVWGSGYMKPWSEFDLNGCKVIALRGRLSAEKGGSRCRCFGDPGLLVSKFHVPRRVGDFNVAFIPHVNEIESAKGVSVPGGSVLVDIRWPIGKILDHIFSSREIVSSSLHGLVFGEAYGKKVFWERWTNRVIGGETKFHDYLTGTDRDVQTTGRFPPIRDLESIQNRLLMAASIL